MEVVIRADPDEVGRTAADVLEPAVRAGSVIGLATGASPGPLYDDLRRRHGEEDLGFAGCRGFLLDEYVGLAADHPQSYAAVIRRELADAVGLAVEGPDGRARDLVAACERYEAAIDAAGGIDVQVLGIGTDGHLGFNEPSSSLASRTRPKTLTPQTRADNARYFASRDDVPVHVLTQGLGTILQARHLLLLATGPKKAPAVAAALEGPVTTSCPASVLQLHPHVTVLLDEPAAAELQRAEYHRFTAAHKPSWQGW